MNQIMQEMAAQVGIQQLLMDKQGIQDLQDKMDLMHLQPDPKCFRNGGEACFACGICEAEWMIEAHEEYDMSVLARH
jgi:hypothetical protein